MEAKVMMKDENSSGRLPNGCWVKGMPGPNPARRGMTNRQRISEKLLADLASVWETHRESILSRLALYEKTT